ncbi:unnamed protein product [Arctia plantaginis]|uniref:Uncharacterized protein n=1 Tax=Arctia plantaginis TaxID=874455 RepID=A0A8S0ZWW3_ARCPL|nr:unnamed protein product [Arctia plantaginis]
MFSGYRLVVTTEKMSDLKYTGVKADRQALLLQRYHQFINGLSDVTKEPVKVFDPLPQRALDELDLIRKVSATLQDKKNEEMQRIAQAGKEAAESAKQAAAEKDAAEKAATDEAVKEY